MNERLETVWVTPYKGVVEGASVQAIAPASIGSPGGVVVLVYGPGIIDHVRDDPDGDGLRFCIAQDHDCGRREAWFKRRPGSHYLGGEGPYGLGWDPPSIDPVIGSTGAVLSVEERQRLLRKARRMFGKNL